MNGDVHVPPFIDRVHRVLVSLTIMANQSLTTGGISTGVLIEEECFDVIVFLVLVMFEILRALIKEKYLTSAHYSGRFGKCMSGIFRLGGVLIVLASLLTGFNSALADSKDPVGDWWLVYSVGTGKNNIVFVADLTS